MNTIKSTLLILVLVLATPIFGANSFIVVIDPGHGGKDPGAIGKISQEKNINLKVAQKLGNYITTQYPDVKVVYTRTTDKYVTLQERPNIANDADGDLFISIHTNAAESSQAYGAETFTLGLSKSNANFEVAKRENSVLLLEEGNQETYQGFDPTSPDSYIMFEFMQSKYIDQSVEMAYYIQQEFTSIKRQNRGVRQAIFWVLHQVKMPSILVELGFITNPTEEKYLSSDDGQTKLAKSIFNAFEKYKHEYDKRTITQHTTPNSNIDNTANTKAEQQTDTKNNTQKNTDTTKEKTETTNQKHSTPSKNANTAVFRIQTFSTKQILPENHHEIKKIKHLKPIIHIQENGWYKYFCTKTTSWAEAQQNLQKVKAIHKDAFIAAFVNDKKCAITEQMKQQK